ncbi:RNA polymerase II associated Paf1 complex component PAF1 [Babesia ovis]|uniref:RNA polymerase II associated Paf1 complex component PAF1 n=1 Tax=Babesia ovis TaxID=5869 RepID=A0A9W5WTI6_BABOV|nr:RNA polymerase II associated Paf1 complex component PAF1 [Babesia ovis]
MPKHKEDTAAGAAKGESADALSAYLHMKSPLLGSLEFDASIPEPPVDGHMLSYDINHDGIAYEPSATELFDGCTTFREFQNGIPTDSLEYISRSNYAMGNDYLISEIAAEARVVDGSAQERLAELRAEIMGDPAMQALKPIISRAGEGLPEDVLQLLFVTDGPKFEAKDTEKLISHEKSTPADHGETLQHKWSSMSTSERIEHYISHINDTFVSLDALRHPTNPHAKIAKHYKVMPNVGLWKNRYIQAGVDGVTSVTATEESGKLAVGGILHVAKDGATQRIYEYYKSADEVENNDLSEAPNSGELFKFVRMYSCQKSTKADGNDNYFLLSLPPNLHSRVKAGIGGANSTSAPSDGMNIGRVDDEADESVVHILSIKGHKMVLTKAGKAKRSDIVLSYTDDESPRQA